MTTPLSVAEQRVLQSLRMSKVELSFENINKAQNLFMKHASEYMTTLYQLRTALAEMGIFPPDEELDEVMCTFNEKMSFNNFTRYLTFLKIRFQRPEAKDIDTLKTFVALGGSSDRQGTINVNDLKDYCKIFDLTIDVDAMISVVGSPTSGTIDYTIFKNMWDAADDSSKKVLRKLGSVRKLGSGRKATFCALEDSDQEIKSDGTVSDAKGDIGLTPQPSFVFARNDPQSPLKSDDEDDEEDMMAMLTMDEGTELPPGSLSERLQCLRLQRREKARLEREKANLASRGSVIDIGRGKRNSIFQLPSLRQQTPKPQKEDVYDDIPPVVLRYYLISGLNGSNDTHPTMCSKRSKSFKRRATRHASMIRLPPIVQRRSSFSGDVTQMTRENSPVLDEKSELSSPTADEHDQPFGNVSKGKKEWGEGDMGGHIGARYRAPSPVTLSQYKSRAYILSRKHVYKMDKLAIALAAYTPEQFRKAEMKFPMPLSSPRATTRMYTRR
eukprot:Tbor_TRINITY_DN2675_c0_g1::TRINITY_DN2675_c0_g1_i3::g.17980::m.17980